MRPQLSDPALRGLRIGYLNPWKNKAENQAYASLAIAARRLGLELVYVTTSQEIEAANLDFVIAVASTQPKLTHVPTFGSIHEPRTRFFSNHDYFINLLSYDGFLTISPSLERFLRQIAAGFGGYRQVGAYYNTPHINELSAPVRELAACGDIRLCYFGTNWDARGRPLFRALSQEAFMRIYGPAEAWEYLDRGYAGSPPFDGESVQKVYAQYGAGLVVLSKDHLLDDVISNRIFEISSVGAVSICPDIPWIRENFGDSVHYYAPHGAVGDIVGHIRQAMDAIRADPARAAAMAQSARGVFEAGFCAEKMLDNAACYFRDWRQSAGKPRQVEREPRIDVIVRVGGRSVDVVRRALKSIDAQRAGQFRVIFVRYRPLALEVLTSYPWKRITAIEQVDCIGGNRAATMAAGLKAVESPFFAMLDDDDFWLPHHIGSLLDQARKLPDGRAYAYSGYIAVAEGGGVDAEARTIVSCAQPMGTIFDILGRLQTGAFLSSSALLDQVDLDGWTLESAEDSLLHGSLIAQAELGFTWRASACWSAHGADASNYVERDSRQEDVFECFARLAPNINTIERKFACVSLPVWERLGEAMQGVFQGKTRRLSSGVSLLVLEEGVAGTSIHEREDIEKRELPLEAMNFNPECPGLVDGRALILPPPTPWSFAAVRPFGEGELFPAAQWVVLEFDKLHGSYGVGILHAQNDFSTRMEAPPSALPMELWLYIRSPAEAASVVVQNWAGISTEPAVLRKAWVARRTEEGA